MLKNVLLFIIICLLLIVFYLNKNEYFSNNISSSIPILLYQEQLTNLDDSYTQFAKNISILSAKNDSSLNNISSLNNVNSIKTNLELPVVTKLFTDISNNINSLYLYNTFKDPSNQKYDIT
jgi:hypothetical protein